MKRERVSLILLHSNRRRNRQNVSETKGEKESLFTLSSSLNEKMGVQTPVTEDKQP